MKLNSKYFDNIRSTQENKDHSKTCDNLGCNEPGDILPKIKMVKQTFIVLSTLGFIIKIIISFQI